MDGCHGLLYACRQSTGRLIVAFLGGSGMWDFNVGKALMLMARTAPYIGLRILVYFGAAVGFVIVTGAGAGIGYGIGSLLHAPAGGAFWGGAIGFGLSAGLLYLAREYLLYLVKAGHIAVLVALMDGQALPAGKGQIAYGTAIVRSRFGEVSVLFAVDQLVKGVIRTMTGLLSGIAGMLPLPGLDALMRVVRAVLRIAVGFVDEVILARAIRTGADNPWAAAEEALVLYGQNHKAMLRNAAWLSLMVYALSFIIFLLALAPAAALVYWMPGAWSAGSVVFALLFAWAFKAALLEPLALAMMMQSFFVVTDGQAPDPQWHARLGEISDRFRQLAERARDWVRKPATPGADQAPA